MAATMTLDEISEFAKKHKVTPAERRAQRVSLMMGLRSKNSSLTREEASSLLDKIEGHEPQTEKKSR
jgi:hypothetical protein